MRAVLEAILTHATASTPNVLARDSSLHEAVLDQQRPVQQPHRAQVRAAPHAAGVARGGVGRRSEPAPCCRRGQANQSSGSSTGWRRCSSIPRSIRSSPTRRQVRARHPGREREQPVRGRQHGGPREVQPSATGSTRGSSSATAGWWKRSTEWAAATTARSGASSVISRRVPVCHPGDGRGARGAHSLLRDRRGSGPRRLRHRLGARPGLARGHHQRLRRGLHGPARHQRRVGRHRQLR